MLKKKKMKLLQKDINKENSGYMIFSTEESDDMWHLYNLISIGDLVSTTTERFFKKKIIYQ